jgi:hypothetical protein
MKEKTQSDLSIGLIVCFLFPSAVNDNFRLEADRPAKAFLAQEALIVVT